MQNWRDLFLATMLIATCVALPQFVNTGTAPFIIALLGCFSLIWRLARVQTDQEVRAPSGTDSK